MSTSVLSQPPLPQQNSVKREHSGETGTIDRPLMGIAYKVISVMIFVVMSSLLKSAEGVPPGELVFFRSFFAMFPIIIYLIYTHQLKKALHTTQLFSHFWRGLIGTCTMMCSFFALVLLPLPETIAISYATPLMTVILSAVILHETVRIYRWAAVLIGLGGVLIIVWPRLTLLKGIDINAGIATDVMLLPPETLGALFALTAALASAFAMMLVRRLVRTEATATIVIYFSLTSTLIALLTIPFGWVIPTPWQCVLLVSAGMAGGIAQIFLTQCYRYADMSTIAPFEYTSMLLGLALGYLVFGDIPTMQMLIGCAIVVASGIFIIYREHQLMKQRLR